MAFVALNGGMSHLVCFFLHRLGIIGNAVDKLLKLASFRDGKGTIAFGGEHERITDEAADVLCCDPDPLFVQIVDGYDRILQGRIHPDHVLCIGFHPMLLLLES